MSQEKWEIDGLLKWARSNYTTLYSSVEIYQDPVTGLSFRAAQDIPPGTNFVSCSYQTTLSYLNAIHASSDFQRHDSQPFPSEFIDGLTPDDPNIIGHFFLMQQYLLGPTSFWWEYIRLLPQPDQPERLGLPIWWSEADRRFLDGTNAEPPILKRQQLWKAEWKKGTAILKERFDQWEDYSCLLYRWAATIFGTRSFRASLTIPEEIFVKSQITEENKGIILDHVRKDRFSVLFPVLDIGNHNGINQVVWAKDPEAGRFGLCTRDEIKQGSQVFNYYGDKSNSELLVGYGFTLPNLDNDTVNLKLTPPDEAVQLRRNQESHGPVDTFQPGEEFMFKVRRRKPIKQNGTDLVELDFFSGGLFDTLACMVCNKRERLYILGHPNYSLEKTDDAFRAPLARIIFCTLKIVFDKCSYDVQRIRETGMALSPAKNSNQKMAVDYRNRQIDVLQGALTPVLKRLQSAASFNSFCRHPHYNTPPTYTENYLRRMHGSVELLSLECAFDWLQYHYPDIHEPVVKIISDDQEEPLPLDWSVLVEDWDHTYWTVWIFLVWMIWANDGDDFLTRHPNLSPWLIQMNADHLAVKSHGPSISKFYAEVSEIDTVNHTVEQISLLPQLEGACKELLAVEPGLSWEAMRDWASYVAHEETVLIEQKMLAVRKCRSDMPMSHDVSWALGFSGSLRTSID
ncbi:Ribosomal lysine N-methyltransferase set10 [Lachnellula suecica]|uniref:Ribosomal lysine N-methyltransferase set10 n=1 Tax=Lachnellula suecica TaxID=602035 RepID=A0A8T9C0U4_9HELO|nr:Ribosomal lysine N-methyltransferase set10 [Lachnellula suecica]